MYRVDKMYGVCMKVDVWKCMINECMDLERIGLDRGLGTTYRAHWPCLLQFSISVSV